MEITTNTKNRSDKADLKFKFVTEIAEIKQNFA